MVIRLSKTNRFRGFPLGFRQGLLKNRQRRKRDRSVFAFTNSCNPNFLLKLPETDPTIPHHKGYARSDRSSSFESLFVVLTAVDVSPECWSCKCLNREELWMQLTLCVTHVMLKLTVMHWLWTLLSGCDLFIPLRPLPILRFSVWVRLVRCVPR